MASLKSKKFVTKGEIVNEEINYEISRQPAPSQNIESVYGKTFFFQQRRGNLNLRGLSSLDVNKIIKDVDIDVLQMHLENIAFCNLKEEDLRYLTDPLVVKLFRVSQLMIEYLLYAQEQLAVNLNTLASKYAEKKK